MGPFVLWVGLGAASLSVGLILWIVGRPWLSQPPAGSAPAGSPAFWWLWVRALEPWCAALSTWGMRRRFEQWQPRAGLGSQWNAARWLAARCLVAALGAAMLGTGGWAAGLSLPWVLLCLSLGGLAGFAWPGLWLQRRAGERRLAMARELPFMLDLLTLCVEAGLSLPSALSQVVLHAPSGPLCRTLRDAAALERTGMSRGQWLNRWAEVADVPGVRSLVLTLAQADHLGMSLGPLLRAQAAQQRSERFLRAEKLALEAPVRMLFPMVLCIFPCTFLVIGFPVVVKFLQSGL
ncbi:Tight adherence protein C OS=Castellaniella defragrans OX=75697 GN=HNR28_002330 PE=4 SV=1 [Castellaniella defragrans]